MHYKGVVKGKGVGIGIVGDNVVNNDIKANIVDFNERENTYNTGIKQSVDS
jgi:hypothetical protein